MRRRECIALLGSAAVWPLLARAQQPGRVRRIGILGNDPSIWATAAGRAFFDTLSENGFVEGKNLSIERRFALARRDLAFEQATELARLDVELIVTSTSASVIASKQGSIKVPIVMLVIFDPVGLGLVESLAHPGGNITGVAGQVSAEMAAKRLALLMEAVPGIKSVAVLMNPDLSQDQAQWDVLARSAPAMNVTVRPVPVRQSGDFQNVFAALDRDRPDSLMTTYTALALIARQSIAEFTTAKRIPSMHASAELVDAGGLMAYSINRADVYRRGATYVAKILGGAKAADLPIEQPTKFELVVNLKTAKALDITIPPTVLAHADEVLE
jgi:putative ABC transport system substrate-binding protein